MIDSTNNKTEPTIMNTNTNPFAAARQNTLTTSAKVLDFDAQSPGVSKPTLSKLLLTREKRGQSDSVLLKPGYRNPGFDYDDDDDGLPLTFKDQVDDKSLSTYASTPKQKLWESPGPNDGLSVITESVGTMTSLDLEGDYPRGKVFFLSPIPPLKKNSKSDFSSETKISLFDAKKCDAKQAQDNSRDTVDSEVNVQTKADLLLPICLNLMCPDLNTISPQTLVDLMNNPKNRHYLIIDCRYGYEYKGGHIKNAVNIQSPEIVEKLFITHKNLVYNPSTLELIKRDFDGVISNPENYEPTDETSSPPILIFHCEFSQQRGPRAYRALRKFDRTRNDYPKLHYPHVYILDGGYHKFHSEFPTYCDPEGGYLPMKHKNHVKDYSTAREEEVRVWKHRLSIDSLTSVESVRKSSLA